jgi:hypothetical protein
MTDENDLLRALPLEDWPSGGSGGDRRAAGAGGGRVAGKRRAGSAHFPRAAWFLAFCRCYETVTVNVTLAAPIEAVAV